MGGRSNYAYLIEPQGYYLHRGLYRLLDAGVNVKVATETPHRRFGGRPLPRAPCWWRWARSTTCPPTRCTG